MKLIIQIIGNDSDEGNELRNINKSLEIIYSSLVKSKSKAISMHKNQRYKNKKKYGIKTKSWWDQSIQLLFEEVKIAYSNYHKDLTNRKLKNEYQQAKKYFRMRKRYNLKLKRTKGLKTLDNLFKLDQKNFWSKIKILTRSNQIVNMELTTN